MDRDARADAWVDSLRREAAGRLTVFLGAAPGVGKTCAMLERAHELRRQGRDVVIGIVETHGRRDTLARTEGLELLPRRVLSHQGRYLEEMDLDALLARRPQIALVDELAHRNAPGSRHERRWQDVIELLDAGIEVYTTVNIQHLESLNDVVHRITGVRVSETVPDALLDRLRDIVVVDLPPRELLERLQQGKVYLPDMAARAVQAWFTPSNLAALRELALQTAADRVDSALRDTQLSDGHSGRSLRRRVVVAIDGRGQSEFLVRATRRIAERRDAPWSVVTVQRSASPDPERQRELDQAFALARRLGADTAVLRGAGVVDALLDHLDQEGGSTLVLGRTRERPWARMVNRTLTQQVLQRAAHCELVIISAPAARARARAQLRRRAQGMDAVLPQPMAWGAALLATVLATGAGALAERWLGLTDLSMVYMLAVVLVAAYTRMSAAVLTAVLSFLAYNYCFIEPRYTFTIATHQGVLTVLLFLLAALVAGRLASRLRTQVLGLRAAQIHTSALQALGRELSSAADLGQVLAAGRTALERALGVRAWLRVDSVQTPAPESSSDLDQAAADWCAQHGQATGRGTDTLAAARGLYLPLPDSARALGVVGLWTSEAERSTGLPQAQRRLAEAMVDDVAQAVQRTRLVAALQDARVGGETERLRSALLASVSHDLRSPLASMIGATSTLSSYWDHMDADDRVSLLDTVQREGERLDRYIQNLLDMTRLGHGELSLRRDWIGVDELIGSAVTRLQRYRPGTLVQTHVPAGLRPIRVHAALVEQALFNVLENAAQFSPPELPVTVEVVQTDQEIRIDIADQGPGIPAAERARIFDMFYSVERGDRGRQGTGLGLTICQGMIGAHGGTVTALPGANGRGTLIRITLPDVDAMSGAPA